MFFGVRSWPGIPVVLAGFSVTARALIGGGGLTAAPLPVLAQAGSACFAADSSSAEMVAFVTRIATGTDAGSADDRTVMHIPQVSASQVTYVTDTRVCSKVVKPYNASSGITMSGQPVTPSGQLYVVQAGSFYVAWDPVKTAGSYAIYATLDKTFKMLWHGLH